MNFTWLRTVVGLALILVVAGTIHSAPVPKVKKQPTEQEVLDKLFGTTWEETEKMVGGKLWPKHRFDEYGWKFSKEGAECWELTGERSSGGYSGGFKFNLSAEPWRLDILSKGEGKLSVLPTIFKFDGDDIVWATEFPGEGWYQQEDKDGNYKDRPTGFDSTEKNRYTVCRLKPCAYYQTEFPKDK